MPSAEPRRTTGLFGTRAKKERRPAGVSRKKKKQFGFEPLEPRQVMSATPMGPAPSPAQMAAYLAPIIQTGSVSSNTPEGAAQVLARELYWQSLIAASQSQSPMVTNSIPTDPLLSQQWHLINFGQQVGNPDFQQIFGKPGEDINVAPVWNKGYTGKGVTVAVIDSGTQLDHPDLAANINLALAMDALTPSGDGNPVITNPINAHGTAVAGLIGAIANNGLGGTGVAPGVTLVPIRLIDPFDPNAGNPQAFVNAFRHAIQEIDITNNSWGPGLSRGLLGPTDAELLALRDSVLFGRGGLGVIHVFSSGNGGGPGLNPGFPDLGEFDSAAYNGWVNSRYTIAVTGVDHDGFYNSTDGTITSYPEISSSVLVAAPTGSNAGPVIANDTGIGSGLITTDLTGDFGFNAAPDANGAETRDPFFPFDRDFLPDTDYTSRMNGTSASAPLVSGVIALMLEANPNLSWRDVQEILVRSARMNAPLGVPSTGQGGASDTGTQNTWIVNQVPIFSDPDFPDWSNPVDATLNPWANPNQSFAINGVAGSFDPDHHVVDPFRMTNGAGYTVSQGIGFYGEQVGYAHGVVNADLAVKLAEQWHTKNQVLPDELSYSTFVNAQGWNLPAAQQSNNDALLQVIPGGIGGHGPFASWWNEYFADDPNFGDLPPLYRGDSSVEFTVPVDQNMKIETVEVKVSIGADGISPDVIDHVRLLLISPDGTHSELKDWRVEQPNPRTIQQEQLSEAVVSGSAGGFDTTGGPFVWTFTTNRSWGERANDALVINPITGEPVLDEFGFFSGEDRLPMQAMTQGWRLVIENYDTSAGMVLNGVELAFHGTPIGSNTQRIQGAIGIDQNRDDLFNYTRMITEILNPDPDTARITDVIAEPDETQELFAENITVVARRTSDNSIAARFVTGYDGNFYFDLVPDDYIISIEDPFGRITLDDTLTPDGLLNHYQQEWHITPEWFKVWDKADGSPTETLVDENGLPVAWLNGLGQEEAYGVKGINFLLDPGATPLHQVTFTGTVYADNNGDGVFNGTDTVLPNISVYGDANQNSHLDAGEVVVTSDANGQYNLVVPLAQLQVMNVGVVLPASWTATNPVTAHQSRFVSPGDTFGGVDFFIRPGADNSGGGGDVNGFLMGTVFEDLNNNGQRDNREAGIPQFTVYIDVNNNGINDTGDVVTSTNQFGAYVFANVTPGAHAVRADVQLPFQQTKPAGGAAYNVTLVGSSTISGLDFGIQDLAIFDYGDLPDVYGTLAASNGAKHRKGVYWLGASVDGELEAIPSDAANGDDVLDVDDEDGIVFGTVSPGITATLTATPSRNGGYLQGWVDWNNDGVFDNSPGSPERVITNALLSATDTGLNNVSFAIPGYVPFASVYARFRYGEFANGINAISTPTGSAMTGEVEDYLLTVMNPSPLQVPPSPDFDGDDDVDGNDFLTWQRNLGRTEAQQPEGDANVDGKVDFHDFVQWVIGFGTTEGSATASSQAAQSAALTAEPGSLMLPQSLMSFGLGGGRVLPQGASSSVALLNGGPAARANFRPAIANDFIPLASMADWLRDSSDASDDGDDSLTGSVLADESQAAGQPVSLQVDRALDDLYSVRRRQQELDDLDAELNGEDAGSDEAFAALADQVVWPS